MRLLKTTFLSLTLALASAPAFGQLADVIFHNGQVYTVNATRSWAQALAVKDGKIAAIGLDSDVMGLKGEDTVLVDLGDRMVMPGIVDAHTHYELGGLAGIQCFLPDTFTNQTEEIVIEAIKACDKRFPGDGWLYGNRFHVNALDPADYNSKWLDKVVPHRPAQMLDEPGHGYLLNSKALFVSAKKVALLECD